MSENGRLFGTDGVRGTANVHPMTAEMALSLGQAIAHVFRGHGRDRQRKDQQPDGSDVDGRRQALQVAVVHDQYHQQNTHAGGIRTPMVISWPDGIADAGGIRSQFVHAIDFTPTIRSRNRIISG